MLFMLGTISACGSTEQSRKSDQAKFNPPDFENIAKTMSDLRELMIDLIAFQACDRIQGYFTTLSAKGASVEGSSEPAVGVMWIQNCTAHQIDAEHLRIDLMGKGWHWIDRTKENVGAKFEVDENVKFSLEISMVGTVNMSYDKEHHILTSWLIPTRSVDASFQVIEDVQVDTESLWGSIVGAGASLIGEPVGERAEKTINKKGASKIQAKLSQGVTLIHDLCTGQRYTKFGSFPAGKIPKSAAPAEGKNFLVNSRGQLNNKGLILAGPFETTQPVNAKLNLEEGGGLYASLVCKKQAEKIASMYIEGNSVPEIQALQKKEIRQNNSVVDLEVGNEANCPVMLVMRPVNDENIPVIFNYIVFHKDDTQKPLVSCTQ